jgi:hypothetical protein
MASDAQACASVSNPGSGMFRVVFGVINRRFVETDLGQAIINRVEWKE